MRIIEPSVEIISKIDSDEVMKLIEKAGRVCYKSEDHIAKDSAEKFIKRIIKSGHESVIEHYSITVKFVCDRGVSHEIVRSRLASYSQESTRYAAYNKDKFGSEITVINPCFWKRGTSNYKRWVDAMANAEATYMNMMNDGAKAQEARSVLPNSLKTEVYMTANIREWRHTLNLRCDSASHPQMREVMKSLLIKLHEALPVFFDDLYQKFIDQSDVPIED